MSNQVKAINSGKWTGISTVISTLFQFVQVAILARLLGPAAFGIVSISTLIINFFMIFAHLGFSNSIISLQESNKKVLSSIYFLNILSGIAIYVIINLSTPLIIAYYHEPKLEKVISVSSLFFLIRYCGQIYQFLLQKELKFKALSIIDITCTVIGSLCTILLAYAGYEEMSLVYGQVINETIKTSLYIINGLKLFVPALFFNLKLIREHLKFGLYNAGEGITGFIQGNLDNIIIGGLLGVKLLGFYTIAYQLAVFPVIKLNPIILQVAYPFLARLKASNDDLKRAYLKILDIISYFNLPLLAGLFIVSDSIIPLLYGPGWEQSISLIKIFVFASFFNCLCHPLYTLAFSKGKPNYLFYLNVASLVIKLPLMYLLGKHFGATGIAVSFLMVSFITLTINFTIVHSLVGSFIRVFYLNILKPLTFSLAMVLAIYCYKSLIGYFGLYHTITQVLIGGLIYGLLTLAFKTSYKEIKAFSKAL
jgi:lipopolysaccharide exporter